MMKSYVGGTSKELESVLTGQEAKPPKTMGMTRDPEAGANASGSDGSGSTNSAEVSTSSGTTHERVFFHVLMIFVSAYGAMFITSWGPTNGAPENSDSFTQSQGNVR